MMSSLEQLRAGLLAGSRHLKLRCGLRHFPAEIFTLAGTLEVLDLSGNALSSLPDDLGRLTRLRVLFCSDNQFTELPPILAQCKNLSMIGFKANRIHTVPASALPLSLRWLILTDNAITSLPAQIGQCSALQKLMLAGNHLSELPIELAACSALELLRISANCLTALPGWLLSMPKLAWLACGGNPFSQAREDAALTQAASASIDWQQLALQEKLGEGASGEIYRAVFTPENNAAMEHNVAVKLYKAALTSDGLPRSEMAACFQAGEHASLIPMLGSIDNHPDGRPGMMMPLIAAGLVNLAGPPSLASCTRDVYADGWQTELPTLLGITLAVALAANHLHARGILHGDLYGHNILHDHQGQALLGDFGAASLYDQNGTDGAALQRLEVRAFGCLLEELLERVNDLDFADRSLPENRVGIETIARLAGLKAACLHSTVASRPCFDEIVSVLAQCVSNYAAALNSGKRKPAIRSNTSSLDKT